MPDIPTEENGCKDCKHCKVHVGRALIWCKLHNRYNGYKYAFTSPCDDYKLEEPS